MATSWRRVFPRMHRDLGPAPGQKEIRAAPADAAPILAIYLPKGSNRSYSATWLTLAPSFMGGCATSLRQAPRAMAAMTAARTIAPFMVFSIWSLASQMVSTRYLMSHRQIGARAEFHGHMFFAATGRQRDRGRQGRDHNRTLDAHDRLSSQTFGIAAFRYRGVTLRSRTQPLVQGFCAPIDALLPRVLAHIGQLSTPNLEDCVGSRCNRPRSAPRTHQRG